MLCTIGTVATQGVCHGDSDGPLAVNGELVGITSWGVVPCFFEGPDVFTRVTSYLDWIDKHME